MDPQWSKWIVDKFEYQEHTIKRLQKEVCQAQLVNKSVLGFCRRVCQWMCSPECCWCCADAVANMFVSRFVLVRLHVCANSVHATPEVQDTMQQVLQTQQVLQGEINQCTQKLLVLQLVPARVDTMAHLHLSLTEQIQNLDQKLKEMQARIVATQESQVRLAQV